jgi:hypothetical protein
LELFGKDHQLPLLLSVLSRWADPRKLRHADRQLIRRVLRDHSRGSEEQQDQIIARIRSAQLLCNDEALITPSAMAAKLLVSQIQQTQKTIRDFDAKIDEVMKQHPDAHLFTSLRGAGKILAPRLLCAFGSQRDRWEDAESVASFSGIAPVTKQSGKQRQVHRRFACPKYLRQTFLWRPQMSLQAKKNRNFFADGRDRDKRKLSPYGASVLKRDGRWQPVRGKKYRLVQRVGRLSKLGCVKLVFSRRPQEKSWVCMTTNETRWGVVRVLSEYLKRWPIEVLFKESKQYLGLGDYQVLRYRGIERYL